ncbi:MAG: hypothetical protein D6717_07930, partial [Gammaproteobacteria bacterium]
MASLPSRVAGIVFWGLVFLGLAGVFVLVQVKQEEYRQGAELHTLELGLVLGEALLRDGDGPAGLDHAALDALSSQAIDLYRMQNLRLRLGDQELVFGSPTSSADALVIRKRIFLPDPEGGLGRYLLLEAHFPSESEALFDLRRNIILAVGLVVMAFGLLLKLILD